MIEIKKNYFNINCLQVFYSLTYERCHIHKQHKNYFTRYIILNIVKRLTL